VGKKGRPRNALAEREPSGRAKRPIEQTIPPALWGRLKLLNDPFLASEVGRLVFEGQLTRAQAEVAWRIKDAYQRWHHSQRLRPTAKSANLESGYAGGLDVADERLSDEQRADLEAETRKIEENFIAVREEIMTCPRNVRSAVLDVCVYDVPTNPAMYEDLRRFLARMVHFFGSGKARRGKRFVAMGAAVPAPAAAVDEAPPVDTKARRIHLSWRNAVEKALRKLLPKMPEADLVEAMKIIAALRDREEVRLKKAAR
jgi:hypothetical protein